MIDFFDVFFKYLNNLFENVHPEYFNGIYFLA